MEIIKLVSEAPELPLGKELESIFTMQDALSKRDSVFKPSNSKKLTLEFLGNLSKCYRSYVGVLKEKLKPDFDENQKTQYIYEFNNLTSLAFVNLIDLLRSVNIGPDDILNYYETLLTELKLGDAYFFEDNILQTCMQYARHNNIMAQIYNNPEINLRPISFRVSTNEHFIHAGRIINVEYSHLLAENYWAITHNTLLANSLLPTDVEKDFTKYQNQLMEVWLYFFKLLDLLGHNWDSIGRLYSVYHYIQTKN